MTVIIAEPLARCTGHHSWLLKAMGQGFLDAGADIRIVTFSGYHGQDDMTLPAREVHARWSPFVQWLYRKVVGVRTDRVVPSELRGQLGAARYWLFGHISTFAVTKDALAEARTIPGACVWLPEPVTLPVALSLWLRSTCPPILATMFAFPPSARTSFRGLYGRILLWLLRRLVDMGTLRVVVNTGPIRDAWRAVLGENAVELIPLGVATLGAIPDRASEKARLGLPLDRPIVAVLGALRPVKGFEELLAAFRGQPAPCYFLLAGDWPDWAPPDPRTVVQALGRVDDAIVRLGFIAEDEFDAYLRSVDVVSLLYRNAEASSGILSRCLAAGTPALVTSRGSLGALARETRAGAVADPDRPDEIRAALESLLLAPPPSVTGSSPSWRDVAHRHLEAFPSAAS